MWFKKKKKDLGQFQGEENSILDYVKIGNEAINIISPLYNKSNIFAGLFNWCIKENKTVIYIVNNEIGIQVFNDIYGGTFFENICLSEKSNNMKKMVHVSTYNMALYYRETYDVVIYDEVNSRTTNNKMTIISLMEKLKNSYGLMIGYSFESIFDREPTIYNYDNSHKLPLVEPRIMATKVTLEKEIPNNVYEYLRWAITMGRKIIIYVPIANKINSVYKSFLIIKNMLGCDIFIQESNNDDRRQVGKFLNSSKGIIITNDFYEDYKSPYCTDIIIYFSDCNTVTYKDLVYITGRASRKGNGLEEEVLFLCNSETEAMEKCKSIFRELNKGAWSQGLLKL